MLIPYDLAVLRAALLFFEEELVPHGRQTMQPYFEEPIENAPTAEEIKLLRQFLKSCELRYMCCEASGERVRHEEIFITAEQAESLHKQADDRIAAVLLTSAP